MTEGEERCRRDRARARYRPDKIEWLLIAESPPPDPDRFFYYGAVDEKDGLYLWTMKALYSDGGVADADLRARKKRCLELFRSEGFYLIDGLDHRIDGESKGKKRARMLKGEFPDLLRRLREMGIKDEKIVLIKATVFGLKEPLVAEGFNVVNGASIYFPARGFEGDFVREFRSTVEKNGYSRRARFPMEWRKQAQG